MTKPEDILITECTDADSMEELQELLSLAHRRNSEKGLCYATASQSIERLQQKIGTGVCLIAKTAETGQLVGTLTVTPREISYWYHSGRICLIQLLGVHPDLQRMGISQMLMLRAKEIVRRMGISVVVADSAEKNLAVKHLLVEKNDFRVVDCVKYRNNNFVSTVYAAWVDRPCPWSDAEREIHYRMHRESVDRTPGRA